MVRSMWDGHQSRGPIRNGLLSKSQLPDSTILQSETIWQVYFPCNEGCFCAAKLSSNSRPLLLLWICMAKKPRAVFTNIFLRETGTAETLPTCWNWNRKIYQHLRTSSENPTRLPNWIGWNHWLAGNPCMESRFRGWDRGSQKWPLTSCVGIMIPP